MGLQTLLEWLFHLDDGKERVPKTDFLWILGDKERGRMLCVKKKHLRYTSMLCYIIFNVRQESSSEMCLQKFNQFQYYANCCASNRCKRTWIPRIQRPVSLERADNSVVYNSSELPPKTTTHIPVNGTLKATQRKPIVCNKRTTQCLFSLKLLERDIEKSPVWFFFFQTKCIC